MLHCTSGWSLRSFHHLVLVAGHNYFYIHCGNYYSYISTQLNKNYSHSVHTMNTTQCVTQLCYSHNVLLTIVLCGYIVKGNLYHILGVFAELYPELMISQAPRLLTIYVKCLKDEVPLCSILAKF